MEDATLLPGDLILVRGTRWIDRAIEKVSHSRYSHVAGVVGPDELIEAQGFRVIGYVDVGTYMTDADVYRCDQLTDFQRQKIVDYVVAEVGGHYDYGLFVFEAFRYWFHMFIPYKEPYHMRICSTLWCDAFGAVGIDLCPGIRFPSPGDLAQSRLLRNCGALEEMIG